MDTYLEFKDKVILVTGAGRGIGRAISLAFAAQGACVAANDLTPVNLDNTIAQILQSGGRAKEYISDVSKKMPIQALVQQVLTDWGRIDVLVNGASVRPRATILEMGEWDWHRTIDVNLGGPFFLMQSVGRMMQQHGGGVIVNIVIDADQEGEWQNHAAFIAGKTGLIGLTRQAAREFAAYGIRINALSPSSLQTVQSTGLPDQSSAPQGWPDQPRDAADVVLFLCSDASVHINGQALDIDGKRVRC